ATNGSCCVLLTLRIGLPLSQPPEISPAGGLHLAPAESPINDTRNGNVSVRGRPLLLHTRTRANEDCDLRLLRQSRYCRVHSELGSRGLCCAACRHQSGRSTRG